MATQTTGGGSTTSFTNTPQAQDDTYSLSEDFLGIICFDVMLGDLGGAAKTLFSVDNGTNQTGAMSGYIAADLLTQDTARAEIDLRGYQCSWRKDLDHRRREGRLQLRDAQFLIQDRNTGAPQR